MYGWVFLGSPPPIRITRTSIPRAITLIHFVPLTIPFGRTTLGFVSLNYKSGRVPSIFLDRKPIFMGRETISNRVGNNMLFLIILLQDH